MIYAEKLLASRLLDRASESFSNHGCNDMDQEIIGDINPDDRLFLEKQFNFWNCPDSDPDQYIPFARIGDSSWMAYLAMRIDPRD